MVYVGCDWRKRPLVASEVENLFANMQRNAIEFFALTGFSQVAKDKDVKNSF